MNLPRLYRGQTLVIILLGTSVALMVALAVSVRTISSLKQTTTTSRAQAALAAAEAGAEVALANLKNGTCTGVQPVCNVSTPITIPQTSTQYTYTTTVAGGGVDAYLLDLVRDQTQEIKLSTYPANGSLQVCWYDSGLDSSSINALELIYVDSSGNLTKYAINGDASLASNGFSAPPGAGSVSVAGRTVSFGHCQNITTTNTPQILRVKALYNNVSAAVAPSGGATLPPQGYVVNAIGQTSDLTVTKKIRVTKTLPSLPAVFDFGVYSGSATQPLQK